MPALLTVQEDKPIYLDHDQLFKQLIGTFFAEFIELFFPTVYEQLDFSSLKPLSDELFTDLIAGERRQANIVMEGTLKDQDTLIIIHVESQSYVQENFNERMYHTLVCCILNIEKQSFLLLFSLMTKLETNQTFLK